MKNPVVIIGVGEMGGVFARGFLRNGYPTYPINRNMDLSTAFHDITELEAVIVGVGEKDLESVLEQIPHTWADKLILVQNELLPNDWKKHDLHGVTVISVWFEKKHPADYKEIISSPVYGPLARIVEESLNTLGIACKVCQSEDELLFELILKNLYILTVNIAGLQVGGTVGELWNNHQELARAVANEVLDIQFKLAEKELDREALIEGMVKAFEGDLDHKCMGRSAPARLERALSQAEEFGLPAAKLKDIREVTKV